MEEWVALGKHAVLDLLDRELAAPSLEIEARLADTRWPGIGERIEPVPLHLALTELRDEGRVDVEEGVPTRGQRPVSVWYPTGGRRQTAIGEAAGRKRLLTGRYLGWALGTESRPGVTGPAAERVVHASLRQAAPYGYTLARPGGGEVPQFLARPVPVSALDNAAILTVLEDGLPGTSVALPIEVKNIRDWIYPSSQEPYQLLEKAALLQQQRPDALILPVLICRRAHMTAFRMAKDLGFYIIDTRRQYIGAVEEHKLEEVRSELGFLDLRMQQGADERIARRFTQTLPPSAGQRAQRWAITAGDPHIRDLFTASRASGHIVQRSHNVEVLKDLAQRCGLYENKGW